ncbi:MAG: DNA mismatch repair endonuclease MutL [Candidatus Gracilibacteria bacterium]|nr:DNA mismatch repair endonuclease MutL [Candidatus Gracilibacteria bacterium]
MSKIILLDKKLSNQIAAGEVVERPVSVIKEVLENSIDAGAKNIKIEITEGGTKKIIISDDGIGIERDDLLIIGEKHSTSKIKNLDDLYNVMTFGFRGEAIASISSVSNMQIISKSVVENFGNTIKILDGIKTDIEKIAYENGTKIIVEDLFFNTPARLNYIKKPRTEYAHILNYLYEISLSYPKIGFEFISDEKQIFYFKSDENLKTRIYNIYGEEFSNNLIEINFEMQGMQINGYISDPKVSFPNKNKQNIFVNNRPIKSYIIAKAINDAYNRFIPHSMNPAYVLNLSIDPTLVDVNVHPRKLEVRFAGEQNIFRAFYHSVEEKLNSVSLINPYSEENAILTNQTYTKIQNNEVESEKITNYYTGSGTKFKSYSPYKDTSTNPNQTNINSAINFSKSILSSNLSQKNEIENENINDLHYTKLGKIIGQAHNSYIIVETKNGIKFLDQHALAERIIYEKLVNRDNKSLTQGLLISESINLMPKEVNILKDNIDTFENMGFDFEIMGGNIVILNGIPDFIKKENLQNIFSGILEDIGSQNFNKSNTLLEVKNKIYAYTACRSAIKFGNKLNLFEMNKLLNDSVDDYSATCPHGRPVVFDINLEELKNKYER